nr:DUF6461 domain-containing protein [Streptosporangium amethystogenes]
MSYASGLVRRDGRRLQSPNSGRRWNEPSIRERGDRAATTDVYAWWSRSGWAPAAFCFTFIADLAPEDVLRRLGLTEDPEKEGYATIKVGHAAGGSIMVEEGHAGILRDVVHALSLVP